MTAVEFALIAMPFFILSIGILEVGLVQVVNRMVDNAVVSAARMIRTGQAQEGTFTADEFKDEICGFLPAFMCDTNRISVEVVSVDSFAEATETDDLYDDEGEIREDLQFVTGGASEIVVMHVIFKWPMIMSNLELYPEDRGGLRHLTSTMVFRNEPWE
ncbi:TadE/TadG family type IV pilus assembly protein [Roseibium marinum]|uniref:TadE/TadG family type IV pilus assembly protein n=1 Tax=Roseibium marinum TaxID=281252 RepID=UPI001AD8B80E|nr:TadE/TadG family type IV pilus assembly protein [Roseibium marinum]